MARGFGYAPINDPEVEEAGSPGLAKERIRALADSRNTLVRAAVAARDDCPVGLMAALAHDFQADVRAALAANPRLLASVMEHLVRDRNVDVLRAIIANPAVTATVLETLAGHRKRDVARAAAEALEGRGDGVDEEDSHTPELRDRVFDRAAERRADAVADTAVDGAIEGAIAAVAAEPPAPELPMRTRTAPLPGFRPPLDV